MLQRITRALVAAVCFAVAAGVALVAASYALFALLKPELGAAGAAAVVAAVAAVLVLGGALFLSGGRKPRHAEAEHAGHEGLAARLLEVARGHPLISVGAALAGLYVVMKRPGLLALIAANLLGAQRQKQRDRRG
jgi:hypothetical protein